MQFLRTREFLAAAKIPFQTRIGQADRKSYAIGAGAFSAVLMRWGLRAKREREALAT